MRFEEEKFKEYLLYDLLVRGGTEVYYLYWVKEFFKYSGFQDKDNWQEHLEGFLKDLKKQDAYQEWQGKQAEKAIRLYFQRVTRKSPAISVDLGGSQEPASTFDGSAVLLNRFRDELRKKNCAAKAEKVYLNWAELFLVYAEKNTGKKPDIHSNLKIFVRRFFTYLEVNRGASLAARKQAFSTLALFFRMVFNHDISDLKRCLHFEAEES